MVFDCDPLSNGSDILSVLTPPIPSAANAARTFESLALARAEPLATIELAWDSAQGFVRNIRHDPSLIRYDDAYSTQSSSIDERNAIPTAEYLGDLLEEFLAHDGTVADVGCGQGELVEWLDRRGTSAMGYDPVCRRRAPNLVPEYWSADRAPADLYIMRCVLPHIPNPWAFLNQFEESSPGCLVLIEFQDLSWTLSNSFWPNITHDHVNYFGQTTFSARFEQLASGAFGDGEWGWALVRMAENQSHGSAPPAELERMFRQLARQRAEDVQALVSMEAPIAVWGAAGKGATISFALGLEGCPPITAIDADPSKWGRFLEGSGTVVQGPSALDLLPRDAVVLVANPRHTREIADFVGDRLQVTNLIELRQRNS